MKNKPITFILKDLKVSSLNKIMFLNPRISASQKHKIANEMYLLAYQAGWRPATMGYYTKAVITIRFDDDRRRDPDNYGKILFDALCKANLIKDDNSKDFSGRVEIELGLGRNEVEIKLW